MFNRFAIHFNVIVVSWRNRRAIFYFSPVPFAMRHEISFLPGYTFQFFRNVPLRLASADSRNSSPHRAKFQICVNTWD
jgi:hypothetical protein